MNQREFAASINIEASKYNKWETGANRPDYETICMLADRLNVTTDFLLGRTDIKSPKADDIAVHAITGLSAEAIHNLAYCYSNGKDNSITLAVNALLEEGSTLGAISRYLYYCLDEKINVVPYHVKYKFGNPTEAFYWGEGSFSSLIDAGSIAEAIDNKMYKRLLLIEIQEQLEKLLEHEDQREHFTSKGGI